MDIILAGMQGSGKGTQGKLISQKFGHKIFETGKELRKIRDSGTELGNKVKERIDNGHLVDTNLIMEIVEDFLKNISKNDKVIFDGLPRNLEQYTEFHKVMQKFGRHPKLFYISLSKEDALKRLLGRFECVGVNTTNNPLITKEECVKLGGTVKVRDDDTEEAINKRLDIFFSETLPIIEKYKELGKYIEINGLQSVEVVFTEIEKEILKTLKPKNMNIFDKIRNFCRIFRIILGTALITSGFFTGILWFYLGIIPLIAGILNFCPICIITKKCSK